jgi:acetyltransferase-like isoleucine patch superfamily enzyme
LHVGDNVRLGGKVCIISGAVFENPRVVLSDRSIIGWNTSISVNREVIIEEDAIVSYDCRISDTDGHPRDADLRAARLPPLPREVLPVRICKKAFVGNGTHVMKGVTIGEGAVIGANSVVISNIPPYCLAMGNPAEIFIRNYGRPKQPAAGSKSTHSA